MIVTDLQLHAIAREDRQAFAALYQQAFKPMMRYLVGLLAGDRSAAEDVYNEAMTAIWLQACRFDASGSPAGWIRRIMRNKAVDWLRKQAVTRPLSEGSTFHLADLPDEGQSPFEAAAQASTSERLRHALATLSVDHREVVWLCYFEELPLAEIATLVGCPENTVKTRLFHARKELKTSGLLEFELE